MAPEVTEQAQSKPLAPHPGPTRRSRTATESTESTTTESEPAEPSKPTRKTTTRGTKAGTAARASPEPEAESGKGTLRRGTRNRSQSVEVAPAPAPALATAKRRVGAKSKKAVNETQDALAEDPPVGGTARRGKTKATAAETEDESTGTGTLRAARGGRRAPNGTTTGAAGATSNRVVAVATTGKGRMIVGAGASLGKSAARAVGEKENTPERVHVKEEDDEKAPLPSVAVKSGRARKAAAATVSKAQSETEKDVAAPKMRAPRRRAASGKK
jgi:hypothetical protein